MGGNNVSQYIKFIKSVIGLDEIKKYYEYFLKAQWRTCRVLKCVAYHSIKWNCPFCKKKIDEGEQKKLVNKILEIIVESFSSIQIINRR